jgi:hypothetical protein
VTAAGLRRPSGVTPRLWVAGLRLARLHLAGRQVPAAMVALVGCAAVLRLALHWHWIQGSGPLAQQLPLLIEGGAAMVIAVTTRSPFGELERAAGHWLPWLRLGTALALTGAAIGMLAAGGAAAHLPGGDLAVLRNVAGLVGIGLLSAAVLGGSPAWVGLMAYLAVAEFALTAPWTTPWIWPARPPHDHAAALCAALAFAAGTAAITVRGARDTTHE